MEKRDIIIECLKKIKGAYFTEEKHLVSGGWLDSFEMMRLILDLEDAFSIKIPISRIAPENLDNVEEIEALLESELNG